MKIPHKGFTLIELMIVLAIISIIVAIAIPSFRDNLKSSYGGSAMKGVSSFTTKTQTCIQTGVGCLSLNNEINKEVKITEINNNQVIKDVHARLEWDNGECIASAIIGTDGSLSYSAKASTSSTNTTDQQCKEGSGL